MIRLPKRDTDGVVVLDCRLCRDMVVRSWIISAVLLPLHPSDRSSSIISIRSSFFATENRLSGIACTACTPVRRKARSQTDLLEIFHVFFQENLLCASDGQNDRWIQHLGAEFSCLQCPYGLLIQHLLMGCMLIDNVEMFVEFYPANRCRRADRSACGGCGSWVPGVFSSKRSNCWGSLPAPWLCSCLGCFCSGFWDSTGATALNFRLRFARLSAICHKPLHFYRSRAAIVLDLAGSCGRIVLIHQAFLHYSRLLFHSSKWLWMRVLSGPSNASSSRLHQDPPGDQFLMTVPD